MRFSIAALVAGFAATSSAFLLPPHVGDLKDEFKDTRFRGPPKHFKDLIHSLLEEKTTTVDLECPGCPYAASQSEDGAIVWEQDVENVLVSPVHDQIRFLVLTDDFLAFGVRHS